jgi:hypothetical protein
MSNAQPGGYRFGKSDRLGVAASGLDHQTNDLAAANVEKAAFDQIAIHDRVEERIIDDIVDVSVGVIIHPAGGDRRNMLVARTRARALSVAGVGHCCRAFSTRNRRPTITTPIMASANTA